MRALGARRISALLPEDATGTAALLNCGYTERTDLRYFDRIDHVGPADTGLLTALGGRIIWASASGTRWPAWRPRSA